MSKKGSASSVHTKKRYLQHLIVLAILIDFSTTHPTQPRY